MAVININPISMAQGASPVTPAAQPRPAQVEKTTGGSEKVLDAARKEIERRADYRESLATKEYGPVISRSSDGDTVRVKASTIDQAKAMESAGAYEVPQMSLRTFDAAKDLHEYGLIEDKLQDFDLPGKTDVADKAATSEKADIAEKTDIPEKPAYEAPKPEFKEFEFPEEVKEKAYEAPEVAATAVQPQQSADTAAATVQVQPSAETTSSAASAETSLQGVSDAELQRKYLQGDISQTTYNQEMESRAAREEQLKAEFSKASNDITNDAAKETENERSGEAIEALGSEDSSKNIPIDVREQFVQTMDDMGS